MSDTPRCSELNERHAALTEGASPLLEGATAKGFQGAMSVIKTMIEETWALAEALERENGRLRTLHSEQARALSETQKSLDESIAREAAFLTHHCESEGCAVEGEYTTKAARWADQYHAMKAELAKVLQQQADADNERDAVEEGLRAYAGELAGLLSCAVLYVGCVSDPQNPAVQRLREDIKGALAKNPNPAGLIPATEASGSFTTEASGAGRAGTDVHTDHPLRHYDRTCPACVHETGKNTVMGTCTSTVAMGTVCGTGVAQTEREAIVADMKRLRQRAIDLGMPLSSVEEINAGLRPQSGKKPLDYEAMASAFSAWISSRPAGYEGDEPVNSGNRWFDAFAAGVRWRGDLPHHVSNEGLRAAAERMVQTFRDWMAGCSNETRWKEVEAAHINLRDALVAGKKP